MIGCFGPSPDHPVSKTSNKRGENLVASPDLEECVCAFGLAEDFPFDFFDERLPPLSTCEVGFLLKIPQVVSHFAQLLVVVGVGQSKNS